MITKKVKIVSTSSFISHNGDLANPMNKFSKEIKKYSSKRTKTEDDHRAMAMLEMEGGLYRHNDELYIPAEMIESCLIGAAKLHKLGTTVKRALRVVDRRCPFTYDGPKSLKKLLGHPDHTYQTMVKVGTSKILRTRAIFDTWESEFTISFAEDLLDEMSVDQILLDAGELIGIGDRRPRFGGFQVAEVETL